MSEVKNKLCSIFNEVMHADKTLDEIVDKNLIEEFGVSSIDSLEILIRIESEFEITIDDEDLSQELISSLDNIEGYINERITNAA